MINNNPIYYIIAIIIIIVVILILYIVQTLNKDMKSYNMGIFLYDSSLILIGTGALLLFFAFMFAPLFSSRYDSCEKIKIGK